jgi:ABC-type uncharacterized transport system ATPase subunit
MAIEARNITKHFGDFCALDDVSVNVESGSLTALLRELVAHLRNERTSLAAADTQFPEYLARLLQTEKEA